VQDTPNYYWLYSTRPPTYWFLGSFKPPNSPDSRVRAAELGIGHQLSAFAQA
jgi:hypothetical protein